MSFLEVRCLVILEAQVPGTPPSYPPHKVYTPQTVITKAMFGGFLSVPLAWGRVLKPAENPRSVTIWSEDN